MSNTRTLLRTGELTAPVDESKRHEILASERRRLVLQVIDDGPTTVSMDDLAEAVAARESPSSPDHDAIEHVRISLHHKHLPMLADAGVLEYDGETRQVRK